MLFLYREFCSAWIPEMIPADTFLKGSCIVWSSLQLCTKKNVFATDLILAGKKRLWNSGASKTGLGGKLQLLPEAPVLAVVRLHLPFPNISWQLCSHCNGLCLRKHHGVVVEGH